MRDKRFNKVVIWGYPLNTHTHSFIHYSFYKAFKSIGYKTYWMTDENFEEIDFKKTLFITSGDQEKNIPLRNDCYYVLHNVDGRKYLENMCKILLLQVYTDNIPYKEGIEKVNEYTFFDVDELNTLFTCWATDLLPHEIDLNSAKNEKNRREALWVGTFGDYTGEFQNGTELHPFFSLCSKNGILVKMINPWNNPISFEENRKMVNNSFISPAIQGPWQIEKGYIPCRIFKNISYGHMGYTNSPTVNRIFSNELVFSRNTSELFYKGLEFKENPNHIERLKHLMNEVKENHTYINRIKEILNFLPE